MSKANGAYPRRVRPKACLRCGKPATKARVISFRGYCSDCAVKAMSESGRQLQAKSGPYYEQWLRSRVHELTQLQRELDSATG